MRALTEAVADRDRARDLAVHLEQELHTVQECYRICRADRDALAAARDAEHARAERLATQAGHLLNDLTAAKKRAAAAAAALDRVRELCDQAESGEDDTFWRPFIQSFEVRAAIAGAPSTDPPYFIGEAALADTPPIPHAGPDPADLPAPQETGQ